MGSRLSYKGDQKDLDIIDLCQKLILSCIPGYKNVHFKTPEDKNYFFETLTEEQINLAFSRNSIFNKEKKPKIVNYK